MDLGINLVFLIIFGLIGFVISIIWGFNPYRIFSDISIIIIVLLFAVVMYPDVIEPEKASDIIQNMVELFANVFPGVIIGDIAGSFVGAITGE
jgi:hypothetical protein